MRCRFRKYSLNYSRKKKVIKPRKHGLSMHRIVIPLMILALIIVNSGCVIYHSRYFYSPIEQPACVDSYCFSSRVFAYINEKGSEQNWEEMNEFIVSFRVFASRKKLSEEQIDASLEEREVAADLFEEQLAEVLRIDSVILHEKPSGDRIRLVTDSADRRPRTSTYVTYQFGTVNIPPSTESLGVTIHLTRFDGANNSRALDSVSYELSRYEYHDRGLPILREEVRGYD